jgi:hypothetical protein
MKFYTNNNKKYRGEVYNILNAKLQVFYNYCITVGVLEEQYYIAFLIILKNQASDFYYNKIMGRLYNFITIVQMVKTHFKTEETASCIYWNRERLRINKSLTPT